MFRTRRGRRREGARKIFAHVGHAMPSRVGARRRSPLRRAAARRRLAAQISRMSAPETRGSSDGPKGRGARRSTDRHQQPQALYRFRQQGRSPNGLLVVDRRKVIAERRDRTQIPTERTCAATHMISRRDTCELRGLLLGIGNPGAPCCPYPNIIIWGTRTIVR